MSPTATAEIAHQTNSHDNSYCEFIEVDLKENPSPEDEVFFREIETKIFSQLKFPEHWKEKGVSPPNSECKLAIFGICKELFKSNDFQPSAILPSIEEGIYLSFDSISGTSSLIIEVYNNLEVAALINDNQKKEIVCSADIINSNFKDIVEKFNDFK